MEVKVQKPVFEFVTIGYKCNVCGDEVIGDMPNNWHYFDTHHDEWGTDSSDSYRYFHVCSVACFAEQLKISLHNLIGYKRSARIADMNYEFAERLYELIK